MVSFGGAVTSHVRRLWEETDLCAFWLGSITSLLDAISFSQNNHQTKGKSWKDFECPELCGEMLESVEHLFVTTRQS